MAGYGGRRRVRVWLSAALALPALGACSDEWDNYNPFHPAEIAAERVGYVPGESPIYCYVTLATPDCYAEPQPGPPNRLIHAIAPE